MLLSFWKGTGGKTVFDIVCGVVAVIGILISLMTGSGVWALTLAVIADIITYTPTIVKTWHKPESESPLFYALGGVAALIVVLHDGFVLSSIFQLYIAIVCMLMVILIYRPKITSL